MELSRLKQRIESMSPGTHAEVIDLTGTLDHFQATVTSPVFSGKTLLEQHKMIFSLVQEEINTGEIHALTLKINQENEQKE